MTTLSRKEFILKLFAGRTSAAKKDQTILPPGSADRAKFYDCCTKNYDCIAACPHEAIMVGWQNDNNKSGFPLIDPQKQACLMCQDFPCVSACKSGALDWDSRREKIGIAVIDPRYCFAFNSHFCQSCVNACPESEKAIRLNEDGKPVIDKAHCTGCGQCVQKCPAEGAAIYIQTNE